MGELEPRKAVNNKNYDLINYIWIKKIFQDPKLNFFLLYSIFKSYQLSYIINFFKKFKSNILGEEIKSLICLPQMNTSISKANASESTCQVHVGPCFKIIRVSDSPVGDINT